MKRLLVFTHVCFVVARCYAIAPHDVVDHHEVNPQAEEDSHYGTKYDRCEGIEFDAIAPDEKGIALFFKGDHLWKGFSGPAELANLTFQELDEYHHLGHADAAFRMHSEDEEDRKHHDHVFFFLDDQVFSYYNHTLEKGFPLEIQQVFPDVPSHLDAAVECPKGECTTDSVLFFKGHDVYSFDIKTKTVKKKTWDHLPVCTSAFRWVEHYYCFHGHNFTRFHPVSGEVEGNYPKEARRYFMRCPNIDHGAGHRRPRCKLDAITTDSTGKSYAFIETMYIRLDTPRDGVHPFPIARSWKEVSGHVDAVFSYGDKIYIIQGNQIYIYKSAAHYTLIEGYPKPLKEELSIEEPVDATFAPPCNLQDLKGPTSRCQIPQHTFRDLVESTPEQDDQIYIYKSAAHYTLIEGYPKSLKEELGIEGPVDAAFVCDEHIVHVIQGQKMLDIDLEATPRVVKAEAQLPFPKIDAATCHTDDVKVFVGGDYYLYQSPKLLAKSKILPESHKMSSEMFGCEH
ncbi:hemopexin isoform X1 [Hemibagrus wyckioides]|uniref:hemopexin isoform X1 n=1 Tax=Hemibagrus wyckioides TaxID=337641 RepID=UPI00266BC3A9|nr:hemopexin isoform X1 [Hemibagrus wyckioides]